MKDNPTIEEQDPLAKAARSPVCAPVADVELSETRWPSSSAISMDE